jgi:hypothetical protein
MGGAKVGFVVPVLKSTRERERVDSSGEASDSFLKRGSPKGRASKKGLTFLLSAEAPESLHWHGEGYTNGVIRACGIITTNCLNTLTSKSPPSP